MVTSKIRHRFYDRDGNEHVLNATSDDQGKITDEYSVEYADENEHKKHWFPLDMQTVGWLPLDMRKP